MSDITWTNGAVNGTPVTQFSIDVDGVVTSITQATANTSLDLTAGKTYQVKI